MADPKQLARAIIAHNDGTTNPDAFWLADQAVALADAVLADEEKERAAREQAERLVREEREHADRLAEVLDRVRGGANLGERWAIVVDVLAAHAAHRGGENGGACARPAVSGGEPSRDEDVAAAVKEATR